MAANIQRHTFFPIEKISEKCCVHLQGEIMAKSLVSIKCYNFHSFKKGMILLSLKRDEYHIYTAQPSSKDQFFKGYNMAINIFKWR